MFKGLEFLVDLRLTAHQSTNCRPICCTRARGQGVRGVG